VSEITTKILTIKQVEAGETAEQWLIDAGYAIRLDDGWIRVVSFPPKGVSQRVVDTFTSHLITASWRSRVAVFHPNDPPYGI
jgi:hypothetical protein